MNWTDRLIGVWFGVFVGLLTYLAIMVIGTFVPASQQPLVQGLGSALFLGLSIWGWHGGAYALGRVVAWLRRK